MFTAGQKLQAKVVINIRRTPGYVNKDSAFDVVGALQPGEVITVLGNTLMADDLPWVQFERGFVAARSTDGEILLAPREDRDLRIVLPVPPGTVLTQGWGENPEFYSQIPGYPVPLRGHNGIDWGAAEGTPIYACDTGVVVKSEFDNTGFGELVKIQHGWGESIYAHLSQRLIPVGHTAFRGQKIGLMGNTGLSHGSHLHFGIRINPYDRADGWGGFSNPMGYFL